MKKSIIQTLKVLVPVFIGAYLVWYMIKLIREQNQEDFWKTIETMDFSWLLFSLLIGLMSHLARAHRWKYLLEPLGHKTRFSNRYHAIMVGYVVNLVLPRAGEASRAGVLGKTNEVPFSQAFGTIIAERLIDVLILFILGVLTIVLSMQDFQVLYNELLSGDQSSTSTKYLIVGISVLGIGLILLVVLLKNQALRTKVLNFISELKSGFFSLFKSKNRGAFTFYSALIWVLYVCYFGICFFALKDTSTISFQGILMAFIAGTLGVMLTPGGLGSYPILVGTVITFYVYPEVTGIHNNALALATVIWLSQTLFLIVLGLISLFYISRKFPVNQ